MVMNRALADAWSAGLDWMLQLDIDELLYFPREVEREAGGVERELACADGDKLWASPSWQSTVRSS